MDKTNQLRSYVTKQRQIGVPDSTIRERLLGAGLFSETEIQASLNQDAPTTPDLADTAQSATAAVNPTPTPTSPAAPPQAATVPPTSPHDVFWSKRLLLLVACIAVIITAGLATYHLTRPKKSPAVRQTTIQQHINDPNFSLALPVGWRPSGDYKPGAGLSTFYPAQGSGSLVVYVLPATSPTMAADHVDTQLNGLKQNGGTSQVVSTASVMYGTSKGSLTVAETSQASSPSVKQCDIFAYVTDGSVAYNLDLTTSLPGCSGSRLNMFTAALESFQPKTTDLGHTVH